MDTPEPITYRIQDLILSEEEADFVMYRYPSPHRMGETIQDRVRQIISDAIGRYWTSVPPGEIYIDKE